MKSTTAGRTLLLVIVLFSVVILPRAYNVHHADFIFEHMGAEPDNLRARLVSETVSPYICDTPASVFPARVSFASTDEGVLFQRVIAELVKTFYIA